MDRCPESVSGSHSPGNARGTCDWCGQRWQTPAPRPPAERMSSELMEAYAAFYDPDYGAPQWDWTGY